MTRNPLINALAATFYIAGVAGIMFYGSKYSGLAHNIIGPMAAVSLFTLSAAVMGFVFLYQPFQLYFENKKKAAVNLFLSTVVVFGAITALLLMLFYSGLASSR